MDNRIRSETTLADSAREFLAGYRLCEDMLHLRRYERKRLRETDEPCCAQDILAGSEILWKTRMDEIRTLLANMKNGREKLILYYHFIRGESVEHAADLLGVSRRTGYRMLRRGLVVAGAILERLNKANI